MPLAFAWGTFFFWVAVSVAAGVVLALLLGGWNWAGRLIQKRRQRPKADPPDIDLNALGRRQRAYVEALLRERKGYVKRGLKERVEQVDTQIIKARDEWWEKAHDLRIALIDIRSELESARRLLAEASERQSFWNPEQEQLPAARWEDHRQTLAGEDEVEEARAAIEAAYQDCNRLNQLVLKRVDEEEVLRDAGRPQPEGWALSFDYYEKDAHAVNAALADIDKATAIIDTSLESL